MYHSDINSLLDGLEQHILDGSGLAVLSGQVIAGVEYDSRKVGPGQIFFCIPGEKSDGHDFAAEAMRRGAIALAVERRMPLDIPQLVFADTRLALALSAQNFYGRPSEDLQVVAVTGTNGKTTSTFLIEWIARFSTSRRQGIGLEAAKASTGLIGTVVTDIGGEVLKSKHTTPESSDLAALLATMRDRGVGHVSMEVSSHAIALRRVHGIKFAVAAFTNLSQDHLDFHGDMEAYFDAKAALFERSDVAMRVIDIDTDYGKRLSARMQDRGFAVLTCGLSDEAEVSAKDIELRPDGTRLILVTPEAEAELTYPLIGGFNVSNVLLAASVARLLGYGLEETLAALEHCPQIPGRLERVRADGTCETQEARVGTDEIAVFVDYSHTPDSISKAIEALRAISRRGVTIVFGCGGDRDRSKRPLMAMAAAAADRVVITSDNPRSEDPEKIIADILVGLEDQKVDHTVRMDREEAIEYAIDVAAPGDCVLVAGKGHEDYQIIGDKIIDLDDRIVAAQILAKRRQRERTCAV